MNSKIASQRDHEIAEAGAAFMCPPGTVTLDHGKVLRYHEACDRVLLQEMVDSDPNRPHRLPHGTMGYVPHSFAGTRGGNA